MLYQKNQTYVVDNGLAQHFQSSSSINMIEPEDEETRQELLRKYFPGLFVHPPEAMTEIKRQRVEEESSEERSPYRSDEEYTSEEEGNFYLVGKYNQIDYKPATLEDFQDYALNCPVLEFYFLRRQWPLPLDSSGSINMISTESTPAYHFIGPSGREITITGPLPDDSS